MASHQTTRSESRSDDLTASVVNGGPMPTEALLAQTLAELAGILVGNFDVVELLTGLADRCVKVLDIAGAGVMVGYPGGDLRVMASSSEAMRGLELFALQSAEGPCLDCHSSGKAIMNPSLAAVGGPWPRFAPRALEAGFRSVHALPMRAGEVNIGVLNLFRADEGALSDIDMLVAQALADVATIAILRHHDGGNYATIVNEQLRRALDSRIVIEQAKGMVAEDAGVDTDEAFGWLREHAGRRNLLLIDVARDVVDGALTARLLDAVPTRAPKLGAEVQAPPAHARAALGADPSVAQRRAETLNMLSEMVVDGQRD